MLQDGEFNSASLRSANLSGGNFESGDFRDADFSMANLNNTDFTDADLEGAMNMANAININTAVWGDTDCPDGANSDNATGGGCYPDHLEPPSE